MSRNHAIKLAVVLAVIISLTFVGTAMGAKPENPGGGNGNRPDTESTNNLSFPVIATDGFTIAPLGSPSFTVPWDLTQYDLDGNGVYDEDALGLTLAEILGIVDGAPWYAQKTDGNVWQADFDSWDTVPVDYVDWSDSMETVYPKAGTPFRLEIVLFEQLDTPMTAYTMGTLAYPSSKNEMRGTDGTTYEHGYATVISDQPKLVVQYLGDSVPADMTWNGTVWTSTSALPVDTVSFAVELNVSGKYIWGASKKGWTPRNDGYYRVTFCEPAQYDGVDITADTITADEALGFAPAGGTAAIGQLDPENDLAYIDLLVGGEKEPGGDEGE